MQSFTYDLATPVGSVRYLISDTNEAEMMFADEEILHALANNAGNRYFAGAEILSIAATDAARCAVIAKSSTLNTDPTKVAELLSDRAEDLRTQGASDALNALYGGNAHTRFPDPVFTTDANYGTDLGTMDGW